MNDAADLDAAATKDIVEGNHILLFTAKADEDVPLISTAGDNDYDQDDTIKLRAMVSRL